MKTIEVCDIGPIEHLSIPIPSEGGVCVLTGANGAGKSTALRAVESLVSGRGKLDVRDKAVRGEVQGLGVKIAVAKSTRRSGELEVTSLEGRLSVAELVDPGLANVESADSKRIKSLVALTGIEADPGLFTELLEDDQEFARVVSGTTLDCGDLIEMASRVKRDFEAAARGEETKAEQASGHGQANREAAQHVDLTACDDADALQAALEQAIRHESQVVAEAAAAQKAKAAHEAAAEKLAAAKAEYSGLSTAEAQQRVAVAGEAFRTAAVALHEAEQAVLKANEVEMAAKRDLDAAQAAQESAVQHAKLLAQWEATVDRDLPHVDGKAVDKAREAMQVARAAVETGALVRRAKQQLAQAEQAKTLEQSHRQAAERYRKAAHGTDAVLSGVVAKSGSPLRVDQGRLVLETDRGVEYFAELSEGERWRVALDIAIDAVGEQGLLVIDQAAWEGLDIDNRQMIHEHCRRRGVTVLTAEASRTANGALRAESYEVATLPG